jgi:hypothetical protein
MVESEVCRPAPDFAIQIPTPALWLKKLEIVQYWMTMYISMIIYIEGIVRLPIH